MRIAVTGASGQIGAEMTTAGEDPWWMYAYPAMFASIREQRRAAVSDEVRRLTDARPRPSAKRSPAARRPDTAQHSAPGPPNARVLR
jgi:hypothetical protein